ncbi:hypothetical protein NDU88_001310 [Pleurodeles waltl]|uniref:Uncharacterized protein n=1 Tax=Pleurodeles waltl TaxID=8319 RepID=A0AAV7WHY8_PLEWA|nr:hypothetical protein NDU88_001310 [Pleurodeles waltl]
MQSSTSRRRAPGHLSSPQPHLPPLGPGCTSASNDAAHNSAESGRSWQAAISGVGGPFRVRPMASPNPQAVLAPAVNSSILKEGGRKAHGPRPAQPPGQYRLQVTAPPRPHRKPPRLQDTRRGHPRGCSQCKGPEWPWVFVGLLATSVAVGGGNLNYRSLQCGVATGLRLCKQVCQGKQSGIFCATSGSQGVGSISSQLAGGPRVPYCEGLLRRSRERYHTVSSIGGHCSDGLN